MTTDQRFGLIIALLSLIFLVMSTSLAFIVRAALMWGRNTQQLQEVVTDLREIKDDFGTRIADVVEGKEREHGEIKERLTYLERRELNERRGRDPRR